MINLLDNKDTDIVVALYRESPKKNGRYDRVVWCISEQRFIYGDEEYYMVCHGDDNDLYLDTSREVQELIKKAYNTGITFSQSVFYDENNKLYEITNSSEYPKLIFDANTLE